MRWETEPEERSAVIHFLCLNGHTPWKAFDEIKENYGGNASSYDLVNCCHCEFKHGQESMETAPAPDDPLLPWFRHLSGSLRLSF